MAKFLKRIFPYTVPVLLLFFLIYFFKVIKIDFKFAHQTSMVYQKPFSWQRYLIFSELKRFKNRIFDLKKLDEFKKIDLFINEANKKKLLSNTPNSTKKWVNAQVINQDYELQNIQLRYRGDNPGNWLKYKKSFRIKTNRNKLINGFRRYDFFEMKPQYFIPFFISEKMRLINQSAEIVDIFFNGESHGLYIKHENMDELFLRKNKIMPVNIYKGTNNALERHIGLNHNLFNNSEMWTKISYFNQQNKDNKVDLNQFLIELNSNRQKIDTSLNGYIDLKYFSRFEAFLTILQNDHHYFRDNMRLIIDPWNGKVTQLITDPIIRDYEKFYLDFSSNDLNLFLNKNTDFIHEKYLWLYQFIKNEKIIENLEKYFLKIKKDLREAEKKEPYNFNSNFVKSFERHIDIVDRHSNNIVNLLEKKTNCYWKQNNRGFSIIIDDRTPASNLNIYFNNNNIPEWVGIDLNYDNKISKNEPKIFNIKNSKVINIPIAFYSNREKKTNLIGKIDHGLNLAISRTKFNFISSNNKAPEKITNENLFTKSSFNIKLKNKISGVQRNKFNKIVYLNEINKKNILYLSGKIIVDEHLIYDKPVKIAPGTEFLIYPNKNIIFKNKLTADGSEQNPIVFKKFKDDNETKSNWGTVAILGKKTSGSSVNYTDFIGGSGGKHKQFRFTSMFSIHNSNNIIINNSNFTKNSSYDDVIHIVYSDNIIINNITVEEAFGDAIDIDISKGVRLNNIKIYSSKNDGIDFMESNGEIKNSKIVGSKDKGVSIGESSFVNIINSKIEKNKIGIAVKDMSISTIMDTTIRNNDVQIAAYSKNWQYGGGGKVTVENSRIFSEINNFVTSGDPEDLDKNLNKDFLKQDSKIELINNQIKGDVIVKGDNFLNKVSKTN